MQWSSFGFNSCVVPRAPGPPPRPRRPRTHQCTCPRALGPHHHHHQRHHPQRCCVCVTPMRRGSPTPTVPCGTTRCGPGAAPPPPRRRSTPRPLRHGRGRAAVEGWRRPAGRACWRPRAPALTELGHDGDGGEAGVRPELLLVRLGAENQYRLDRGVHHKHHKVQKRDQEHRTKLAEQLADQSHLCGTQGGLRRAHGAVGGCAPQGNGERHAQATRPALTWNT